MVGDGDWIQQAQIVKVPLDMTNTTTLSWLFVFTAVATYAGTTRADQPVRDHDIVAEDYFSIGTITGCVPSPDGTFVAYTEVRWEPPAETRNTDLWVVAVGTRETTRLTFDSAADGSPEWSPDGRWLYFTSGRKRAGEDQPPYDGKKQVWRIRPDGSELKSVTRVKDGIGSYHLSGDGKVIYYTVSEKSVDDDPWKKLREQFGELEYGHGVVKFSRLYKLDLQRWRAEKIVEEDRVIGEFVVSPDQRWIAMKTTPTANLITNEGWSQIDIYNAKTKSVFSLPDKLWRTDAPSPYGWLLGLTWSGDGRSLAFRCDFDGYPGQVFVAHFDDEKHLSTQEITRHDQVFVGGHMEWLPDSNDLCFVADDHARRRVYRVHDIRDGRQGQTETLTPGDVAVDTFGFSRDGDSLAVVMSGLTHPPDIFVLRKPEPPDSSGAGLDRITRVNPQVDTWKLPSFEIVKWTSSDGTPVEGVLELPPDYQPGTPLPTIIELHGGPTSASKLRMRFWIYGRVLFPARGWALLSPNYRGSTGYGDKFLTDLIGNKNNLDVQDILSGVDWATERGIADPDKLAVMGWSNGGYLTNCLITNTTRFKAASSGAGVFDVVLQWLTEDTPGHVINFNKGLPWERTGQMQKGSALYNVDKVTTPTLIHVGENDPRCPPGHTRGLYRALRHYLNVPTELIVYPGAAHGLTNYEHRKAKMEWDIQWFDYHVLGKMTDEDTKPGKAVD